MKLIENPDGTRGMNSTPPDELTIRNTTENLSTFAFCDEFICKNCGIHLAEWIKLDVEDYEEYEFKFCPECGAKVKDGEKPLSMKLFRVHYEASLIVSMPEPCGVMKEAICKGDMLIEVQSAEAAEAAIESMIENYFCIDDIISIHAEEEPIPPDEFPCEECNFNSNGTCVLII